MLYQVILGEVSLVEIFSS